MSVQIGKCKSSVKTALKELDDVYVKIPSDEIVLQPVDNKAIEKMAVTGSEKQPSFSRKIWNESKSIAIFDGPLRHQRNTEYVYARKS